MFLCVSDLLCFSYASDVRSYLHAHFAVPLPEPEKLVGQMEALKHVDIDALTEKVGGTCAEKHAPQG